MRRLFRGRLLVRRLLSGRYLRRRNFSRRHLSRGLLSRRHLSRLWSRLGRLLCWIRRICWLRHLNKSSTPLSPVRTIRINVFEPWKGFPVCRTGRGRPRMTFTASKDFAGNAEPMGAVSLTQKVKHVSGLIPINATQRHSGNPGTSWLFVSNSWCRDWSVLLARAFVGVSSSDAIPSKIVRIRRVLVRSTMRWLPSPNLTKPLPNIQALSSCVPRGSAALSDRATLDATV